MYRFCFRVCVVYWLSFYVSVAAEKPTVLLVTSSELKEAWSPYVAWKKQQGKAVRVVTTEEINQRMQGKDLQEKIRLSVRQCIEQQGIRWVVLGGDSQPGGKGHVPDRDTYHENMWGVNEDIPTDIYYISPTNWDADGDGVYGEFEDDQSAITYPDGKIGLGRIPVRTVEDVKSYTEKVMSYESQQQAEAYSRSFLYSCEVRAAYAKVTRSWDDYVSKVLQGGEVYRYFSHSTPWDREDAGDCDLSPSNWIAMLNSKQIGKYHFHGHGLLHGWVLEKEQMFTAEHVAQLANKDAYPIITTVSCFTGHYDAERDPCISESMLRVPNAGAIAIVAPCREGKPHFVDPKASFPLMVREGKLDGTTMTMTNFWEKGIGQNLTTGEALMQTKASLAEKARQSANFHMCLAELNLLGDPTIMVHVGSE